PEAQLDRFFFKIVITEPDEAELVAILGATTGGGGAEPSPVLDRDGIVSLRDAVRAVVIAEPLVQHAARVVRATQPDAPDASDDAKRFVRYGAGVRGAQTLVLAAKAWALLDGRTHVSFADLERAALPALRHRLVLNFEGEAEGVATDDVVRGTWKHVPTVPDDVAPLGA
ncbi:MAG: MoxR family ATPase, partial [Planctomycetota bacterium]